MRIISAEESGLAPARRTSHIPTPSAELWLHHTVGKYRGKAGMRKLQRDHFARGFRSVGYSFVIDTDDPTFPVYEGAGAGILGAHTRGHNSRSHGIAVTGNFENREMPTALKARIAQLVRYGHEQGWWPDQITGGHRDTKATACPGRNAYSAIPDINRLVKAEAKEVTAMSNTGSYAALVEDLYQDLLGRPSDPEGKEYWIGVLEDGTTIADVRHEFLTVRLAADRRAMEALAARIAAPATSGGDPADIADQAYQLFLQDLAGLGKSD